MNVCFAKTKVTLTGGTLLTAFWQVLALIVKLIARIRDSLRPVQFSHAYLDAMIGDLWCRK